MEQIDKPPAEAICKDSKLHDYRTILSTHDETVDQCQVCGRLTIWKKFFNKITDEEGYIKSHFKDFLQPEGPTRKLFIENYGIAAFNDYQAKRIASMTKTKTRLDAGERKELKNDMIEKTII